MIIFCNGKEQQLAEGTVVSDLLASLNLNPETVVVECNTTIVKPEEYTGFVLPEGAKLELIRFVGGG